MLLGTVPRKIRDGKRTTGFEHERNGTLRDLGDGGDLITGSLEFRVGHTVGDHCFREMLSLVFVLKRNEGENKTVLPHSKDTLPGLKASERPPYSPYIKPMSSDAALRW